MHRRGACGVPHGERGAAMVHAGTGGLASVELVEEIFGRKPKICSRNIWVVFFEKFSLEKKTLGTSTINNKKGAQN